MHECVTCWWWCWGGGANCVKVSYLYTLGILVGTPTFLFPSRYLTLALTHAHIYTHTHDTEGECLPGGKHEELACPAPEGAEYEACFQWRDGTCCTADFTRQLSRDVITNIFEFRWDTCGNLSLQCQEYFKRVECFYR